MIEHPIDAATLRRLLSYDPEMGNFVWIGKTGRSTQVGTRAGRTDRNGYRGINIMNRKYAAHRLAWLYMTGEWPKQQIDHINGKRDDNRFSNLRDVSSSENRRNSRRSNNNRSGHTGVSFDKSTDKWRAVIKIDGKQKEIGRFRRISEAIVARKRAETGYGFTSRHGGLA